MKTSSINGIMQWSREAGAILSKLSKVLYTSISSQYALQDLQKSCAFLCSCCSFTVMYTKRNVMLSSPQRNGYFLCFNCLWLLSCFIRHICFWLKPVTEPVFYLHCMVISVPLTFLLFIALFYIMGRHGFREKEARPNLMFGPKIS